MLTNNESVKNLYYQQLDLAFEENWANEIHHLAKQYSIIVEEGYVKSLSREKWKTYITNKITEYGFNECKSKQSSMKKLQELKYEKFEIQNYLLELQPDIAREAFKVSGMIDVRKNYSNKYNCHLCPVCTLEEETMDHLVSCDVNMLFEDFQKVYGNESRDIELVAVAVRESVNTRNRFI